MQLMMMLVWLLGWAWKKRWMNYCIVKRSFGCNSPGLHGWGKETGTQNISIDVLRYSGWASSRGSRELNLNIYF
jgi:hypothetical protein